MRKMYSIIVLVLFCVASAHAQYNTVGAAVPMSSADPNATCFTLNPPLMEQKGAVWNSTRIDLSKSFEFNTRMFFGASDAGADGIAFVLQNEGTSYIGHAGAGIGYHREPWENPVPSFIIEFDTWFNEYGGMYDPNVGDHVGFMSMSSNSHSSTTFGHFSPTELKTAEAFNANIEDNQWHDVKFTWNATTKTMTVVFTLSASPLVTKQFVYTGDIVNTIFGGNPMVYWGFTAATGGIGGTSSATYNEHKVCVVTVPPPPGDCGQLRTQTPGGWGAKPAGKNNGTYLYGHFAAAFPAGLTIGSVYTLKLTTPQAITAFLPSGGQAKALTQSYVNPVNLKNVLAGHLVALTLSVGFDRTDPNFGRAGILLGNMKIGSGPFMGWTVNEFLVEANKVFGNAPSIYSVQQVLGTAAAINENYADGKQDNGFLVCPNNTTNRSSFPVTAVTETPTGGHRFGPNPTAGIFTLALPSDMNNAQVIITNASGAIVERRQGVNGTKGQLLRFNLSAQSNGLYYIRIVSGKKSVTEKILVLK